MSRSRATAIGCLSMKLPRYRRPSLNTILGITKAKKRVKQELGITVAMNWGGFDELEKAVSVMNRREGG